nr:AP-2 complex subunit sigma [Ipomoea batatas]
MTRRRSSCEMAEPPKTSCSSSSCNYYYYSSNSHYSEAVADCIDFFNKSSSSSSSHHIRFILLQNRQGKTRLAKYYFPLEESEKHKVEYEVHRLVVNRDPKFTNFVEFRTYKIIYRRYAGLFFSLCVDITDNELAYLECIHLFVEILDHFFSNVCELDLVFNFHKVYLILDEFILAGELQETSKKDVIEEPKEFLLDKILVCYTTPEGSRITRFPPRRLAAFALGELINEDRNAEGVNGLGGDEEVVLFFDEEVEEIDEKGGNYQREKDLHLRRLRLQPRLHGVDRSLHSHGHNAFTSSFPCK